VPSDHPGQVEFPAGQMAFHSHLPHWQGIRQAKEQTKSCMFLENPRLDSKIQKWILHFFAKQINPRSLES